MRGDAALSASDRVGVDALVERMHGADDFDGFVDVVLRGLMVLIPSINVSYGEMNPADQTAVFVVYPPLPAEVMGELVPVVRRRLLDNPLVAHFLRTGDTRALMWSDVVEDMEEFRRSEIFPLFFDRFGISTQMAVTIPAPEGVVVGIGLNRGEEGFGERDRAVLNALRPHLAAAHRAMQTRREADQWRTVLAAEGWAVVLVDSQGYVVRSVPHGPEPALRIGFPLEPGEPLPEPLGGVVVAHVGGYGSDQLASRSAPVRIEAAGVGFDAWVVPSPVPPHVVLVKPQGVDRRALLDLGLSSRQADVAAALAEGGTNRQIATRLGMAEATVKKHLEHIFARLGVDNRAAAVAVIRSARSQPI